MVTDKVIMANSAQPAQVKFATLSQELVRQMKNMSRECTVEERAKVCNKFMVKMSNSGHNEEMRKQILRAGTRDYCKMVENEIMGISMVNRLVDEGRKFRELKKLFGPTEWYQPRQLQSPGECSIKEEGVMVSLKS